MQFLHVFAKQCGVFFIFLIVLAATLLQNGRWQKHQGFLLKSLLKSYIFGASMWGDTQDWFTPIGKADYLGPEACVAVFACCCESRCFFYSFFGCSSTGNAKIVILKGSHPYQTTVGFVVYAVVLRFFYERAAARTFFGLLCSLNAVFTRFCESVRTFSVFLIVLAATCSKMDSGRNIMDFF